MNSTAASNVTMGNASVSGTRFNILGIHLTGTGIPAAVSAILGWVERREKRKVCIFAVDSILKCRRNPRLVEIANSADMVLTDGMPLVFLGKKIGHLDISRCYGPDVMLETIRSGCPHGIRHFLYGGSDETVLAKLEENLKEKFSDIRIAGSFSPPHRPLTEAEADNVVNMIDKSGADIVWVGIGTPKQDFWVGDFRPRLAAPVLIAVGAAFNFHAGTVLQAPRWMMRSGLEWLFRLAMEPRRLWKRYIIGNPLFVSLVLCQWLTGKPAPLCSKVTESTLP